MSPPCSCSLDLHTTPTLALVEKDVSSTCACTPQLQIDRRYQSPQRPLLPALLLHHPSQRPASPPLPHIILCLFIFRPFFLFCLCFCLDYPSHYPTVVIVRGLSGALDYPNSQLYAILGCSTDACQGLNFDLCHGLTCSYRRHISDSVSGHRAGDTTLPPLVSPVA